MKAIITYCAWALIISFVVTGVICFVWLSVKFGDTTSTTCKVQP